MFFAKCYKEKTVSDFTQSALIILAGIFALSLFLIHLFMLSIILSVGIAFYIAKNFIQRKIDERRVYE